MSFQQNKYQQKLNGLKEKIRQARYKAALTVNAQLLSIYWEVGQTIIQQENEDGWGAKTIERLSIDLKTEFEDMKGLSVRNLRYMREFAKAYPHFSILQPLVAKLPKSKKSAAPILQVPLAKLPANEFLQASLAKITWYHHLTLLDKVKNLEERIFYINKTIENGWSRNVLVLQIDNKLFERQGKSINNFENALPAIDSDLAKETFKSSYVFDFLSMGEKIQERDLEKGLISHLKDFMLELGKGFAYVGNQKNINVEGDDYFLDLLFYNYNIHCFVVFELKIGDFKPEYAGKLNFYVNTINQQLKGESDKTTIGVLLCKTPNETVIKYSLEGITSPIGVSDYKLANSLPKQLKAGMPTIEELEKEIEAEYTELQKPVDKKIGQLKELIKGLKQTPVKEKRSAATCERILTKVVFVLRNNMKKLLEEKEIAEKFEAIEMMVWTDSQGHRTDKAVNDYLKQNKEVGEFRVELRLKGFVPAGTKAFDVWKNISIATSTYNYTIGFDRNPQNTLIEKLYHQLPDKKEFETIMDKWMEAIVDNITQQLELIKLRK